MNSDVQTGVKSAGWLKRITQLPVVLRRKIDLPLRRDGLERRRLVPDARGMEMVSG